VTVHGTVTQPTYPLAILEPMHLVRDVAHAGASTLGGPRRHTRFSGFRAIPPSPMDALEVPDGFHTEVLASAGDGPAEAVDEVGNRWVCDGGSVFMVAGGGEHEGVAFRFANLPRGASCGVRFAEDGAAMFLDVRGAQRSEVVLVTRTRRF
jgi:hypothetical protein